ncbi:MAG TPA: Smr/MutS family protein [Chloroflexia bacterium]|nr:Smr/MutS family protein [Chloroflexia bacterium]
MNQKTLTILELPKVLARLASYTAFRAGRAAVEALTPSTDLDEVRGRQQRTSEAVRLLDLRPDTGLGGVHDIRESVKRADLGAALDPLEFLAILSTMEAARELRVTILRAEEQRGGMPGIAALAGGMTPLPRLEGEIRRTFDKDGNIPDHASPALGRIRAQVRIAHDRLMSKLQQIVNSSAGNALQEPIISMRGDRYVVPVKSDFRGQLKGIVHDQSSSGATLWVEPLAVVDLANDWRKLQLDEQEEIQRILRELAGLVAAEAEPLTTTVGILAELDLALACAKYSSAINGVEPGLGLANAATASAGAGGKGPHGERQAAPIAGGDRELQGILLRNARHPLLTGKVVPINVELGERFRVLVITGPNTGGKTVALKTVGLLTLMAMCGLHIPADSGSRLLVFERIFADIGDEQSIEQSLSTFSSHMSNIISILKHLNNRSLVLLDELGAGTDPQEGAALARALVEHLLSSGALAIATTHYSELKAFAYTTEGVENASVEFDVETLSPTYRLTVGLPGRSNALAIATRLGLQQGLVKQAQRFLNPEDVQVENLLETIQRQRDQSAEDRAAAERARREMEARRRDLERQLRDVDRLKQEALVEARAQAEDELAELRDMIRRVRVETESSALTREWVQQQAQRLESAQKDLKARNRRKSATPTPAPSAQAPAAPAPLRPGDRVYVPSLDAEGEVLTAPDANNSCEVQLGAFKLRVKADDMERARGGDAGWTWQTGEGPAEVPNKGAGNVRAWGTEEPAPRRPARAGESVTAATLMQRASAAQVPLEIDLRGYRAEEIEPALDPYLQDAALAGMPMVRIIHGKGTGVLREVVRNILKKHPLVQAWAPGPNEQGGEGVSLAYFDKRPAS